MQSLLGGEIILYQLLYRNIWDETILQMVQMYSLQTKMFSVPADLGRVKYNIVFTFVLLCSRMLTKRHFSAVVDVLYKSLKYRN